MMVGGKGKGGKLAADKHLSMVGGNYPEVSFYRFFVEVFSNFEYQGVCAAPAVTTLEMHCLGNVWR